jgi:glutamate synthase (NADPH/NADH) large chain
MTGGTALIIGKTGRNFAAGMSGGLAFLYDEDSSFAPNCNVDMVDLVAPEPIDLVLVKDLLEEHVQRTQSPRASSILANWDSNKERFVKVFPKEYRRVLQERATRASNSGEHASLAT